MLTIASFYSVFQPLTDVFQSVLKFFHDSGGISWGWSIVLLTIAVRAILVPLTLRQIKGMVRMQAFAPQLKEIQAKYKDDKQRQQEEMMKFYRENNINPLASCLPLVLQFPVFIALYAMLRESLRTDICPAIQKAHNHGVLSIHHTIACGHTPASKFLFIGDLTNKATGFTLVILLILYVGSQLGSSVLMSSAAMDQNQRRIMMFMPLIFVAFIFRFPAGLLVYWITTNLWTVAQQYVVKRRMGAHRAALAATGGPVVPAPAGPALAAGNAPTAGSSGGGIGGMLRDRMRSLQEGAVKPAADGAAGGRASATATRTSRSGGGARGKTASEGNGRTAKNGNGNGNGTSSGAGATPPRPPRKKKKRSGRRR